MGGIARQQHSPHPKGGSTALVHAVGREIVDPVGDGSVGKDLLEPSGQAFEDGFLGEARILAIGQPPEILPAQPADHGPVDRIGDHIGAGEAEIGERVVDIGGDEAIRPGEAFELKTQQAADGGTRAVGPDHPAGTHLLCAFGRLDSQRHPVIVLLKRGHLMVPQHLRMRVTGEMADHQIREDVLAEMEVVVEFLPRIEGVLHVGFDRLAGFQPVHLEGGGGETDRLGIPDHAELLQHRERGVIIDRCARGADHFRLPVEDGDLDPLPGEPERGQEPHRTRADHDHIARLAHAGASPALRRATTIGLVSRMNSAALPASSASPPWI